jgi:fucose 4-O-acetylase-like acetyltransferase
VEKPLLERRSAWVDIAKGLGIVLVVYGHSFRGLQTAGLEHSNLALKFIDYAIYSFHMPLFFFLSGMFARPSVAAGLRDFWLGKILRLAYPYLLWTVLQQGTQILFSQFANHPPMGGELLRILWMPVGQFWFLYALFWCHAAFAALRRLSDWLLVFLAAGAFATTFALNLGVASAAIWGFFYYSLGVAAAKPIRHVSLPLIAAVAFCAGFFIAAFIAFAAGFHDDVTLVPAALCGIAATIAVSQQLEQRAELLRVLGYLSMSIFVMHVVAIGFVRTVLFSGLHLESVGTHLVMETAAGVILPVLAHSFLSRTKLLGWFGLSNHLTHTRKRAVSIAQSI